MPHVHLQRPVERLSWDGGLRWPRRTGRNGLGDRRIFLHNVGAVGYAEGGMDGSRDVGSLETRFEQGCLQFDPLPHQFGFRRVVGAEAFPNQFPGAWVVKPHPQFILR